MAKKQLNEWERIFERRKVQVKLIRWLQSDNPAISVADVKREIYRRWPELIRNSFEVHYIVTKILKRQI